MNDDSAGTLSTLRASEWYGSVILSYQTSPKVEIRVGRWNNMSTMETPQSQPDIVAYVKRELKAARSLRTLNLIAAAIHSATIFFLYALNIRVQIPVSIYNVQFDGTNTVLRAEQVFAIDVFTIVAFYLGTAAVFHLLTATVLYRRYLTYLKQHRNPIRWIEYSFSCSLMLVALCAATGITQYSLLVAVFFASATMNLSGLVFENINRKLKRVAWSPFYLGCILGVLPWLLMFGTIVNFDATGMVALDQTILTYASVLVMFSLFPLNMFLAARRVGPWRSYVTAEVGYVTLSYVAKSSLAVMLYFNLISLS